MKERIKRYWAAIKSPSRHYSLGFITLTGFLMGIIFWVGFNRSMESASTEEFCIGCHEMSDNAYEELQYTIHFTNRSGVRAECADCHLPHDWSHKIARKIQASKEVVGMLLGTIDTSEKYEEKRLELAQHEWDRLKANDSQECRNCHDYDSMDFTKQSQRASEQHSTVLSAGEATCIDCHKGISHKLPDMAGVGS